MKQLSIYEKPETGRTIFLMLLAILLMFISGIGLDQASAAGGDLVRPADSDPQPGKQEAKASVVDKAGNLIVTGYQNLAGLADDDFLTVKFNANGTVAWRKTYNRAGGSDQATAIALDSNDNVIVTGFAWNGNNFDIYTVKYNGTDGTKLWDHTYNAPALGNDHATCIAVDNLNNVYVGGYVQTATAHEDYIILKYSVDGPTTEGAPFWVANWNGAANGIDKLTAIAAGTGGIAVTGQSWGSASNFDVMTVKYDYSGVKLWEKSYTSPGSYSDGGRKVAVDAAGNVVMTAAVANNGILDIYTAKYPAAGGEPVWEKTYNNPINNDEPSGLILDSSGNTYITGYTFTLTGSEDLLAVRYKGDDGTKEWEKVYDSGESNADFGTDLLLDSTGNLFVTGNSITSEGNHNIITLKIKNDSSNPALYWAAAYDGPAGKNEETVGIGLGLGLDGEAIVGGWTDVWTNEASDQDYLMLVYDAGLLNPPSQLTAAVLTDTDVKLDWIDNSANEEGFRIERKLTESGEWVEIGTVGAGITSFTDTAANGLTANNTYYYRVRSYNAVNGSSNPSEEIRVLTLFVNYRVPDWSYIYNSPDNLDDYSASGIAAGLDNNPVVTGYSQSAANGFDYYTIKLSNSNGALLWSHRYDDADGELDKATNIAVDSSNAVIVTGYSSLYFPPAASNINSIYTVKYPASCSPPTPCTPAPLWDGQYNGPGAIDDRAVAVATTVDASNSVVVTGYGKNAAENEDIYLLKYASSPALDERGKAIPEWKATPYNGAFNGDDFPAGVAFDRDGNVFVAGHVQSSSAPVSYKSFVAKYCGKAGAPCNGKLPGEIIWEDSFAGSGDNRARSLAVDKDGNLYVAGFDTGANGQDLLLIKYDGKAVPSGSRVLWSRTVDGAAHGDDVAITVKYDQVDDTVIVGGTVLTASNDHDLIVLRFDNSGNRIESRSRIFLRPGSDEEATAMAMDLSGNVSIAGYTANGSSSDAISVEYDYTGTLLAATIFNGVANSYDEAKAVTFNSLGDTLVAGYSTNAAGNADYLVYKRSGLALQASSPFTATQYYTKVELVWSDTSSGETGFYVERKNGTCDSANQWNRIYTAPANTTIYTDIGLNPGQEYCYQVRSFKAGEIEPRWVARYVMLDNPVPPGNVVATPTNTTKIDLSWQDTTTGETGFKIFRCSGIECSDFFELGSVGPNTVTYSDTTVAAGASYRYKVLSYKAGDWESAYSAIATVTTPAPVAPSTLTATRVTEGEISLSWSDTSSDETGFKIERCEGAGCSAFTQIASVGANLQTFNDTIALNANTTYRYQVRAYKTALNSWDSAYSNGAEATTTLAATTGLNAAAANTTKINLFWADNTGTETGFKIERCLGSNCSDFVEVGHTLSNATTWSDSGVCSGSTYSYRVSAVNKGLSLDGGGIWTRRKPLVINNFQPNFQTKVTVAYDADMQADFDDIRFYDETNKREIPYWIESKTDSSTATVWIKTAFSNNTIKLYYGNASAQSASNGAAVFELFDDFDSLAAWTVSGSSVTASGGVARIDSDGSAAMYRDFNVAYPYIAESRYLYPTANAFRNRLHITTTAGVGTGFDYGLFNSGSHRVFWNGTWSTALTINTWYTLQWEVTDSNFSFRTFTSAGSQLTTHSTGTGIANLKRATFSGGESATSDFNLDWFRIRKYAATTPAVTLNSEEASVGYLFSNTWSGEPTASAVATTPVPAAPAAPAATRVSEIRIDLAWTDTTSDESSFRIERCKGDSCSDFAEIGNVGAGVTTFSDTTPMDVDATYRYQVLAGKTATCNGGWSGPPSPIVSAVTTLIAPSALSATASVSSICDDLRFTDSDGSTLLNYFIDSGCGTAATKVWLKAPAIPAGSRQFYMYWSNPNASAMSSGTATFDFFDDFSGTTIDTGKWVKSDVGNYLSQNNELIASGGQGNFNTTTMYSVANFPRPFILELKNNLSISNRHMTFGIKDTSTGATWPNYIYQFYPYGGTDLRVYETSGVNRGSVWYAALDVWNYYKFEVLTTGARYYAGTSPAAYGLKYDSSFSTTTPLKIGLDNASQPFRLDDVRVRKYASPVPTVNLGAIEGGSFSLTGGTWFARRPITITNSGAALTNYQQELTVDTTASASDRISLQWTDNTVSETGFIVERCTGAACDFSTIDTFSAAANASSYTDKNVSLGTRYCYRVRAEKAATWQSAASNSVCAETTNLQAPVLSVMTTSANTLSWTNPTTGEDGFIIERCEGAGCDFTNIDLEQVVGPNVTSYIDTTVCAPFYRYRVKSFKFGGSGWDNSYSNIVDAATMLPDPPGNFTATRVNELQINLSWLDTTTDENGFKVERCEGASCSNFSQIVDLPANTVSYKDYNRVPNTTYRYRIRAYKTAGCGWETGYSAEAEAITSADQPASFTATAPISTLVNLAWLDSTIAETSFKLERCETTSCTYAPLADIAANAASYADASVCAGTGYSYRLSAINEGSANGGGGVWTRRKRISFDAFQANANVLVAVNYDPLMKPDFSDIRFVDTVSGSELPYWIESKTDGSVANVWFKTGTNSDSIYLYFGNSLATNAGSVVAIHGVGLKAYYPFKETAGTISGTTADLSGTGNNLTLTNFAAGYGVVAEGRFGNALSLNGTNNYAKLDTPAVPTGSVASVEAWIYPKAYTDTTYNGIVSWSNRTCNGNGFALGMQNSGLPSMPTWCNDYVPASGPVATLNAWNHVAAVLNGKEATLYMNGQLVGTTTFTYTPNLSSVNLAIGALDYPGRYFNGMIDEVRIYNRPLTAAEIAAKASQSAPSATFWDSEIINTTNTYNWTYTSPYATTAVTTPVLAAPASLTATRNSESQITVSWPNVAGESVFELERCIGSGCDFSSKTTVEIPADTLTYIDKGLAPNTWYRYRIRSRADSACSGYSSYNTTPAQVQTTVSVPSALAATVLNTTQINLAWTDNTAVDTGFRIERCLGASCSDFSQIALTSASATSYADTAVCPGSAYRYRIAALNSGLSNDGSGCWTRRKPVTIANFAADFQTKVVVPYAADMKSDFSDIRFYDPGTYQELPYWIESKIDSTSATVWVKTGASSTIYLYYGNAAAASSSSGAATFQFFDDFSGTTINTSKWTTVGSYYSQNNAIISSGGSGGWDSGIYSVTNFVRPFVFEVDQFRTAGSNMMLGVKKNNAGISYVDFTYAAYPVYDGNGNRLLVYEDGNWRGDNLKAISSDVWQHYKFEVMSGPSYGAKFYHGDSPATYTSYYASTYNSSSPLKIGFTNLNTAFRLDNARVRKYASPEPAAVVGVEEQSECYAFTGAYISGYSNVVAATTPAPAPPATLIAMATTDTNLNLTWIDALNDEMSFRIERCSGTGCNNFSEIGTVGANLTAYSDTVVASTDYCYRVRADKTATCSTGWPTTYSNVACDKSFSPRTDNMVATAVSPFAIRLDWHDLASDEDGYIVQVQVWNGKWIKIATLPPDTTTYLDKIAIEPLKTYTYRVRPYRGSDYSPFVLSNPVTTPLFTQGAGTCP